MTEIYDLIVVGTGSVGSSAGYYASMKGLKVLEVDEGQPPHDQGSYHGDTRIIRHAYGENPMYVPLALRAQELWQSLEKQAQVKIFHETGVLNIGAEKSQFLSNIVISAEQYHLPIKIYDAKSANERWQQLNLPIGFEAILESRGGYLKSEDAVSAYVNQAKKAGAHQKFNTRVLAIADEHGLVHVQTNDGVFLGKHVVVTAGTWVKDLIPNLPIQPVRKVVSWFNSDQSLSERANFPAFTAETTDGNQYYGFPANDGMIKIGRHNGGQIISNREQRVQFGENSEDYDEITYFKQHVLRGVNQLHHGVSCTYDVSPDGHFIIDYVPGHKNIQVVTGLSGHGFKFASVLGEILIDRVLNIEPKYNLTAFSLSRFLK